MADDSSERTEEPTAQRLKKAREEGQVARSVELSTAAILVAAAKADIKLQRPEDRSKSLSETQVEGLVAFLKENGCDEIQRYYFSRPVWPDEVARLLAEEAPALCSTM